MQNISLILFKYHKDKLISKTEQKQVWLVSDFLTKQKYVIKLQYPTKPIINKQIEKDPSLIYREAQILKDLMGSPGIPFMIWSGSQDNTKLLVVEQLGQSLQHHFSVSCENNFSIKTICNLAIQTIKILKNLHQKSLISGKITAKRLQLGKGKNCHKLYINDLSLCGLKYSSQQQTKNSVSKVWKRFQTSQTHFTSFSYNSTKESQANLVFSNSIQDQEIQEWDQYKDIQSVIKMSIQFFGKNLNKKQSQEMKKQQFFKIKKENQQKNHKNIKKFVSIMEILKEDKQLKRQISHFKYISLIEKIKFQNKLPLKNSFDYDWFFNKNIYSVKKKIKCLKCLHQSIKSLKIQNEQLDTQKLYKSYSRFVNIDYINQKYSKKMPIIKKDSQIRQAQTQSHLHIDNDDFQEDMEYYYQNKEFQQCKCKLI